jgi:hypothetical protein
MRRPLPLPPSFLVLACVALTGVSLARYALAEASRCSGTSSGSLIALQLPPAVFADGIADIGRFVEQCPTLDPALAQITSDFTLRRNGTVAALPFCSEPVSQMHPSMYSPELEILQALRMAYYMDRGQRGHLPWTPGTFYDWMKAKIAGIDVYDGGLGYSYCCEQFGGRDYVAITSSIFTNDSFDFGVVSLSSLVALLGHETRHVDGYPHTSCCRNGPGGCDQSFDPSNLTPYGIQWWLYALWLTGAINVGYQCLAPEPLYEVVGTDENSLPDFASLFCTNPPPALAAPQLPGGPCGVPARSPCIETSDTLCLHEGRFRVEASWVNQFNGVSGSARAIPSTDSTGFFWFTEPSNYELIVKILNINNVIKVFYGELTDLHFTVTVTDTQTGAVKAYQNTPGDCGAIDENAFAATPAPHALAKRGSCAAGSNTLCLLDQRFAVSVNWTNQFNDTSGLGSPRNLSDQSGLFSFTDPTDVELVMKAVDFSDRTAFFWAALSDFEYDIIVTDTVGGTMRTYHNPAGTYCGGLDNHAFPP